ncbi:MAG: alpha/beta hydrolase [Sandaracinaceae bacterium]
MERWQWGVLVGAGVVLSYLGAGYLAAWRLTRRAAPRAPEPAPPGYSPLELHARDGVQLGAWWRRPDAARRTVVLVHGNGACRAEMTAVAEALVDGGNAVLPVTVRAHGDSEGERNDIGWSARMDVIAAAEEARRRAPDLPVVVYGVSLGAAATVFAGPELPWVRAFVLVGVFSDLRLAVRRRTRKYLPWGLEALAYGALRTGGALALPELPQIAPARAATEMPPAPVLLVAGDVDDRAPVSDSRQVAASLHDADIVVVPGVDHEDLDTLPIRPSWNRVEDFLARVR